VFFLVSDRKGTMGGGGLGGKCGVHVRNLRTLRVVYWVNISESSGAGSAGLSRIYGC